jgi:hypothetical protein
MPLLTRTISDRPPYRVFEVPVPARPQVAPAFGGQPASPPEPVPAFAERTRGRRATDAVAS